ncbi:heme-binding protein [Leptolyngbya sp. 15MV]|nr:heme-binding protein [Leptolyngbya sp. 15MV]
MRRACSSPAATPPGCCGPAHWWRPAAARCRSAPSGWTPPGAIELKRYPSVRRAEISSDSGEMSGGGGFWPLFRHIQRHNIEMTAPVEMDYRGLADAGAKSGWVTGSTMSFLYRTPELRETGTDPRDTRVVIRDTEPVTVVALGVRGIGVDAASTRPHFATLEGWLRDNPQWVKAGEYRVFGYNGPDTRRSRRWVEVQIPVRPAAGAPAEVPAAERPPAPSEANAAR